MGIYRLALAALVVLFHFGGLPWVVGRIAVFAFYAISGFLIFQVLDRVYLGERAGTSRFFLNRLVRLGPLYLVYAVLTMAWLAWNPGGIREPDGRVILTANAAQAPELLAGTIGLQPSFRLEGGVPVLEFFAPLLPQGWSIGVELSFYLLAPLVLFSTRRRPWLLALWIGAGLGVFLWAVAGSGSDLDRFQLLVYKNAIASWFVFFLGGAFYFARRAYGALVRFDAAMFLIAVWVVLVAAPEALGVVVPAASASTFAQYLWMTLLVTGAVTLAAPWSARSLDAAAGNLSYGVYLNHFIVAGVLLRIGLAEWLGGANTLGFGMAVLAGSVVLAAATYQLVERPFDALRSRVRKADVTGPAPGTSKPASTVPARPRLPAYAATIAVLACLAFLAVPVRVAVARLSAAGEVAPALSPPFDIRWKPDVTDSTRAEVEAELGLVDPQPVERDPRRRTWSYRLRSPTAGRVRALLGHPAVEDTARIDAVRFEIVQ